MITLKKDDRWKVNESLCKVKSKTVDTALLCGASRGGVCVWGGGGGGGQECEREQEAGDREWKPEEREKTSHRARRGEG